LMRIKQSGITHILKVEEYRQKQIRRKERKIQERKTVARENQNEVRCIKRACDTSVHEKKGNERLEKG